jgi:hypothetical protein
MFEAIKSLSVRQRFTALLFMVIVSATTSLGTAYMKGSDCGEISEKYNKSIENYNHLIEISEETQQKYLDARKDIILIQEKLSEISGMMDRKDIIRESSKEYIDKEIKYNRTPASVKDDTMVLTKSNWSEPKKIIIKKKTIVTKTIAPEGAKSMIDSLLQITKKYDKKK